MTITIPACEPDRLRAGTTWTWTRSFSDYPIADGWVLSYAIRGASALTWNAAWRSDDGTTHTIEIPAADTATLLAGSYDFAAYVSLAGQKFVVASGQILVLPNLETATAGDQREHAETMVALIEAELERRMTGAGAGGTGAIESYAVGGRQFNRMSTMELNELLAKKRTELALIRRRAAGAWPEPVRIQFQSPTGILPGRH